MLVEGVPGVCLVNTRVCLVPMNTKPRVAAFSKYDDLNHYNVVIVIAMASQITSLKIVYSTVYLDAGQRKYQSSAWLAFVCGIHRWPVNSPHKGPVTRKMFPFHDVIMIHLCDGACLVFISVESFLQFVSRRSIVFLEQEAIIDLYPVCSLAYILHMRYTNVACTPRKAL